MKKLALGIAVAASALCTALPAMAQVGFYVGPGGFEVGVGAPYYEYYRGYPYTGYPYNGYYNYYAPPRVYVQPGWSWERPWHDGW
jgi:hypothetical protein